MITDSYILAVRRKWLCKYTRVLTPTVLNYVNIHIFCGQYKHLLVSGYYCSIARICFEVDSSFRCFVVNLEITS